MSAELRDYLMLPYGELEELNLAAKQQRKDRVAMHKLQEERLKYLSGEKHIKAVTVVFSDLEGRLHMLDYDKKFIDQERRQSHLRWFSSIRGFHRAERERPSPGSSTGRSFYWVPSDVFGPGKTLVFRRT
jgi:glutamine synthetase